MQETFALTLQAAGWGRVELWHIPLTLESEDSSTPSTSSLALKLPFVSSAIGATWHYFGSSLSSAE